MFKRKRTKRQRHFTFVQQLRSKTCQVQEDLEDLKSISDLMNQLQMLILFKNPERLQVTYRTYPHHSELTLETILKDQINLMLLKIKCFLKLQKSNNSGNKIMLNTKP